MTIEEFETRLEASNLRMEKENDEELAKLKELDELLSREEALAASLYATLDDSLSEMSVIHSRATALITTMRKY